MAKPKPPKPVFTFGKYEGRKIEEIRFKDPRYFDWAYNTVQRFREFVDSLPPPKERKKREPKVTVAGTGPMKRKLNPDASTHDPREQWASILPVPDAVVEYRRRLAKDPCLPYLLHGELHLDPTFNPADPNDPSVPY